MTEHRTVNKGRLEAITDGIIAIAATIMVLELHIPDTNDWRGLLEERSTLLAYLISFFMIYIVWRMHHDLFNKAEVISRKTFMINGLWLFFLNLVPFVTGWVGSAPDANVPEFLYPLDMFLWSLCFQLMDRQIVRDNPGAERADSTGFTDRVIMYGGYIVCMALAYIAPRWSMRGVGILTLIILFRTMRSNRKDA